MSRHYFSITEISSNGHKFCLECHECGHRGWITPEKESSKIINWRKNGGKLRHCSKCKTLVEIDPEQRKYLLQQCGSTNKDLNALL